MQNLPSAPLKHALQQLARYATQTGASACDALAVSEKSLAVSVRAGQLEDIDNSNAQEIGLRVFVGQRQACVSGSDFSDKSLQRLAERAVAMAKLAPEDPHCGLLDTAELADTNALNDERLQLFDDQFLSAEDLQTRAHTLDKSASNAPHIMQADGANAYSAHSQIAFLNSHGFYGTRRASQHGMSVSAIASAQSKGEGAQHTMERDYDYCARRYVCDLVGAETIGQRAATRAADRLGARQIPSTNLPILFDKRCSNALLGAFIGAISGTAIARGVSFLKNELHSEIFPPNITITDDPHRMRGLASRLWDGEGKATSVLNLIENGVLTTWLLNRASAHQLTLNSTGHAGRSPHAPPQINTGNVYIQAGTQNPDELTKNIPELLCIHEMFGPSINANTGDYSVGVSGFLMKNGQRIHPVNEITIAGNLKTMFKTMQAASDLEFDTKLSTPSLLIESMAVAGS